MSSKGLDVTHGANGRAERAGSMARALDGLNRAVRDGCQIHGIALGPVATDGESIEIRATTLGREFTIVIVPGTLDAPDAPAILRPMAGLDPGDVPPLALFDVDDDGCGSEPRAVAVGHGFSMVGGWDE